MISEPSQSSLLNVLNISLRSSVEKIHTLEDSGGLTRMAYRLLNQPIELLELAILTQWLRV